jgi:hypothetical protein
MVQGGLAASLRPCLAIGLKVSSCEIRSLPNILLPSRAAGQGIGLDLQYEPRWILGEFVVLAVGPER